MKKQPMGVIDDGTIEIPLTNKFGRLICNVYIRPSDVAIIDRYKTLVKEFDGIVEPLKNLSIKSDGTAEFEDEWAVVKQVEGVLKEKINMLFDMQEADEIFATRSPFSSVGGVFFCEKVIAALGDIVMDAVADEGKKSAKRMEKYLDDSK